VQQNSHIPRGIQGRPVVSERRYILLSPTKSGPIRDPWATPRLGLDVESTGAAWFSPAGSLTVTYPPLRQTISFLLRDATRSRANDLTIISPLLSYATY
jgi:hypothetical protein